MRKYLTTLRKDKWTTTTIIGALAFSFLLVTTLNIVLSLVSLVVFLSLAMFQKSFHHGLMFLLGAVLVFPSFNVIGDTVNTEEFFVLTLALIGVISLVLDGYKFKMLALFYYWVGMVILVGVMLITHRGNLGIIVDVNETVMSQFIMTFVIYPIIVVAFQHFFQTTRRLERFFLMVVLIGVVEILFTLVMANDSLNAGHFLQLDNESLIILLTITIPVTLGMWIIQKNSLSTLEFLWFNKGKNNINPLVDYVLINNKKSKTDKNGTVVNLKQIKINRQALFGGSLLLQIVMLLLTFSYNTIIIVGIGVFIIGVLVRDKNILTMASGILFVVAISLAWFEPAFVFQSKQDMLILFYDIKDSFSLSLLWQGVEMQQYQQLNSSYLYIFSKFGLVGLLIFVLGLGQYFKEIRSGYLKSDGFERIWLMVLLAIFVEFVFLGVLSNVFFSWPVPLLFWLLYGILQNLKSNKVEYRLTETVLGDVDN